MVLMSGKKSDVIVCLMCSTPNELEENQCQQCNAPLDLAFDAIEYKREPRIISILGDSNAGKTVYLGFLLDMLTQRANEYEAIPKGAYSVDLQQTVISYMSQRMFPPKTPMESNEWLWAYYQIKTDRKSKDWIDLVMPDLAGEALAAEVTSPATFEVIQNLLSMSEGAILLIDSALAANGSPKPDFFGLKMLSYIDQISKAQKQEMIEIPVAVVLSKADHCPESFEDPHRFAEANLNRFWNMAHSRCRRLAFFASSVVGSVAYATSEQDDYVTMVPLHTALSGVLEPFEWIADQL